MIQWLITQTKGMAMIGTKDYSKDSKLGRGVWATYRGKQTCPADCALIKKCYAKKAHTNISFERATENYSNEGETIKAYITSRPKGDKIRHHVSGDFLIDDKADTEYINSVIEGHKKRPDLRGWTYTHAWKVLDNVFKGIKSLTVNASCDTVADIKIARAKGYDTVIVVPKDTAPVSTVDGEKIVICPNQVQAKRGVKLACSDCMLCFKKDRNYTVGFRQH